MTLKGDSLQSWNERRIEEAEGRIEAGRRALVDLEARLAGEATDPRAVQRDRTQRDTIQLSLRGDEAIVYSAKRLAPWLDRFLPRDPFQTVLLVVPTLTLLVAAPGQPCH